MDVTLRTKPVRGCELRFHHKPFPKQIKTEIDGEAFLHMNTLLRGEAPAPHGRSPCSAREKPLLRTGEAPAPRKLQRILRGASSCSAEFLGNNLDVDFTGPWAVELAEKDLLPGSKYEPSIFDEQ